MYLCTMKHKSILSLFAIGLLTYIFPGNICEACTSMIVGASASRSGRPLLWKNRDTGTEHNFVERVEGVDGKYTYVALFNGGDSLLREAWMGMNEKGFAIMNTASYNLAPDTTDYKDREGIVMSLALQSCRTVDDFANLLDTLPKPMGVQANFGVIDAFGSGAYFECDDYKYTVFSLKDSPDDVLIRTNYSFNGNETNGYGYIRYKNAEYMTKEAVKENNITPELLTEGCSKSFYHSLIGKDMIQDSACHIVVDQDFIPRRSTSASVVIEGVNREEDALDCIMWTVIGYPPVSHVRKVTINNVPEELRPLQKGWRSEACNRTLVDKAKAFPIKRGSGPHYIDLDYLRGKIASERKLSEKEYTK